MHVTYLISTSTRSYFDANILYTVSKCWIKPWAKENTFEEVFKSNKTFGIVLPYYSQQLIHL